MPPKSKMKRLCAERARVAREGKKKARLEVSEPREPSTAQESAATAPSASSAQSDCALEALRDTDDTSDFTFDPDFDSCGASHGSLGRFVEDWLLSLDRDTTVSLSLFLTYNLVNLMNVTVTKAAEYVGIMLNKSERTVRQWHSDFREYGYILDSKQGTYQRTGILWSNESLNKKVTQYVRENASVKGRPNLTKHSLCQWINEDLLPNEVLEPGFP